MKISRFHSSARMSQAVTYNGVAYLAGQVGAPGEDAASQTRAILASIDDLLAEAGSDHSMLLQATIWLADMNDFQAMNEVWEEWLDGAGAPARATGEVKLASPDYKVEIIVTAAVS